MAIRGRYTPLDKDLETIADLTPTDGNVIIGDGTDWITESESTVRASLGVPEEHHIPLVSEGTVITF